MTWVSRCNVMNWTKTISCQMLSANEWWWSTATCIQCRWCLISTLRAWTHSILSSLVRRTTVRLHSRAERSSVSIDARLDWVLSFSVSVLSFHTRPNGLLAPKLTLLLSNSLRACYKTRQLSRCHYVVQSRYSCIVIANGCKVNLGSRNFYRSNGTSTEKVSRGYFHQPGSYWL